MTAKQISVAISAVKCPWNYPEGYRYRYKKESGTAYTVHKSSAGNLPFFICSEQLERWRQVPNQAG